MSFRKKIDSGKFVVLGEFDPPKGSDFSIMHKHAIKVKGRVDAIVVPEMARSVLKASSLGGSAFLQQNGIEAIMQVCCRDRNRLALQADILSANALGISNIMGIQGDDIRFGDHPQAREVNDLNLIELLQAIKSLQTGKDLAGVELYGTPEFLMGSILNAGVSGGLMDMEIESLNKMIEVGVRFAVTTPIFDIHWFQHLLKRIDLKKISIIPSVLLLKSAGMARYIDRNIKNITIPSEIIRKIQKSSDKPNACIQTAAELITQLRDMGMSGVMISTMGWEDKLPQILDAANL